MGAILSGGRARRMGGAKVTAELEGRPLLSWPLEAVRAVCEDVAVVAKRDTELPGLPDGVAVWAEPDEPVHPRAGIAEALRRAGGRPVLVVAADLPLLSADLLSAVLGAARVSGRSAAGNGQPLCAVYRPETLEVLEAAPPDERLLDTLARIDPLWVNVNERLLLNVNTPEDLQEAARWLRWLRTGRAR